MAPSRDGAGSGPIFPVTESRPRHFLT